MRASNFFGNVLFGEGRLFARGCLGGKVRHVVLALLRIAALVGWRFGTVVEAVEREKGGKGLSRHGTAERLGFLQGSQGKHTVTCGCVSFKTNVGGSCKLPKTIR